MRGAKEDRCDRKVNPGENEQDEACDEHHFTQYWNEPSRSQRHDRHSSNDCRDIGPDFHPVPLG